MSEFFHSIRIVAKIILNVRSDNKTLQTNEKKGQLESWRNEGTEGNIIENKNKKKSIKFIGIINVIIVYEMILIVVHIYDSIII